MGPLGATRAFSPAAPTSGQRDWLTDDRRPDHRGGLIRAEVLIRGLAAASVATVVALLSHVLAGGAAPGPIGVVFPLVIATSVCVALAALRRSWLRLSVSVALSQLFFHTFFVMGAAIPSSATPMASGPPHAGHGLAGPIALDPSMDMHAGHGGDWMWAAHLIAAVVTIVTLHRGEAVLAHLRAVAVRVIFLPLVEVISVLVAPRTSRRAQPSSADVVLPRPTSVVASRDVRRGPPQHRMALAL